MPFTFPTSKKGKHSAYKTVQDSMIGSWGDGKHPFRYTWDRSAVDWHSYKEENSKGDFSHANPYYRNAGIVVTDKPCIEVLEGSDHNGYYIDTRTTWMSQWLGNLEFMRWPAGLAPLRDNLIAQAITEARNDCRRGRVQNGADIGEARQTAGMIGDAAKTVLSAYRAGRRGNWRSVPQILGMNRRSVLSGRYPANKWLEYQYGWKPLLGSIHDNVGLLDRRLRGESATFTVQKSVRDSLNRDIVNGAFREVHKADLKVRVGFTCRVTDSFVDGLDTAGVLNPLSIAWELLPMSFVLDWFVPVGNVLESLTATIGLELYTGYLSMTDDIERTTSMKTPIAGPAPWWKVVDGGEFKSAFYVFERHVYGDFPMPRLYANTNPFNTNRVLSAISLIRQRM